MLFVSNFSESVDPVGPTSSFIGIGFWDMPRALMEVVGVEFVLVLRHAYYAAVGYS